MSSAHANRTARASADAHRLPDSVGEPPPQALGFGPTEPVPSGTTGKPRLVPSSPSPEEWMRQRFPTVFKGFKGEVFQTTRQGRLKALGPSRLFARCLTDHGSPDKPLLYCPGVKGVSGEGFLRYDPSTGVYESLTDVQARHVVDDLLDGCARGSDKPDEVHRLRRNATMEAVLDDVRGEGLTPHQEFEPHPRRRHVENGVLDLATRRLLPFSPDRRSTWKLPVTWDPDAPMPREFVGFLRGMFPHPEDRDLALDIMALALLGNPLQQLVLITGPGGDGKSTFVKLIQALVGPAASGQLRLHHVTSRFEALRWFGRLVLHQEETGGTLDGDAAKTLKALSGQDWQEAEVKNSDVTVRFKPRALPILTANEDIRVELNGDQRAWQRRLVVLKASPSPHTNGTTQDFEDELLKREGPGILRLVVSRVQRLLSLSIGSGGSPLLTDSQQVRANKALLGFDPLPTFVDNRTEHSPGAQLHGGAGRDAAYRWLAARDYRKPSKRQLSIRLNELIPRLKGGVKTGSLDKHPKHSTKGWRHVRLR